MLVMHSINVVRRNRRLQTCGDFHHYYSLEEPDFALPFQPYAQAVRQGWWAPIHRPRQAMEGVRCCYRLPKAAQTLPPEQVPQRAEQAPGPGEWVRVAAQRPGPQIPPGLQQQRELAPGKALAGAPLAKGPLQAALQPPGSEWVPFQAASEFFFQPDLQGL